MMTTDRVFREITYQEAQRIAGTMTALGSKLVPVADRTYELTLTDWLFGRGNVGVLRIVVPEGVEDTGTANEHMQYFFAEHDG